MQESTRRRFMRTTAGVSVIGVAGCLNGEEEEEPTDDDEEDDEPTEEEQPEEVDYEVWAIDQGTNTGYVYAPDGEGSYEEYDTIDFNEVGGDVPHMVDFSSDYEYAVVGCTGGARAAIVRTEDHEIVDDIETGDGSHFASFTPDDEFIQVDVIGEGAIKRIDADLENEEFELLDDEIDTNGLHESFENSDPICHQYTGNGYSYHTLGPSYHDGALVVVDTEEFEVERYFTHDVLPTNCGTIPHPTEDKFYLTGGLPSDPDAEEGTVDAEGVGEWYVVDTEENLPIDTDGETVDEDDLDGTIESEHLARDSRGIDAHGFWFTPDGGELWVFNRETNNGVVIDPEDDEVIDEIDRFGPAEHDDTDQRDAPDIMWSSPDGEKMFVTLRGPNPLSGDPHAATGVNPGFSVLDIESREIDEVIQPDGDNPDSDFHGIGVVPRAVDGEFTSPPW